jgi:hypothetical protein
MNAISIIRDPVVWDIRQRSPMDVNKFRSDGRAGLTRDQHE